MLYVCCHKLADRKEPPKIQEGLGFLFYPKQCQHISISNTSLRLLASLSKLQPHQLLYSFSSDLQQLLLFSLNVLQEHVCVGWITCNGLGRCAQSALSHRMISVCLGCKVHTSLEKKEKKKKSGW